MKDKYLAKESSDIDWSSCAVVKAHCFADSIEATGISYKNPNKTLKQLEAEKVYIKDHFQFLNKEIRKGLTAGERIKQINNEILERKKKYRNCGKSRVKSKTKADNLISLKKSKKKVTLLAKKNFPYFSLCATMTYEEPEFVLKKVQKDFSKFKDKVRYRFPNFKYLAVYEPHEKGDWHIHMVYANAKGLTRDLLQKLWGHGFIYLEEFSNLAAPYLIKIDDKLKFYPAGARIYTASKNLKQSEAKEFTPMDFEKYVEKRNMKCVSSTARTLYKVNEDGEKRVNHFIYKNYQKWLFKQI